MLNISKGTFKIPTGYIVNKLTTKNLIHLAASGSFDDELWVLLDYYAEIEKVGIDLLKSKGIKRNRKSIFLQFQSFVRQAKNYYYSAKTLHPRSSSLIYYYCFLNLVKAGLLLYKPELSNKKQFHGLEFNFKRNINFDRHCVKLKNGNTDVFSNLYQLYFKTTPIKSSLNISVLLGYCSDIQYQYQLAGYGRGKLEYGLYSHCVNANSNPKTGWALLGISGFNNLKVYEKSLSLFLKEFEQVEVNQRFTKEIFDLDAGNSKNFTFFQSKNTNNWWSDNLPPELEIRHKTYELLKKIHQPNYFKNDYAFIISPPYLPNRQIQMNETIAIYLIMFYLSSLVRYNPHFLEELLNKKKAWLIESFVKFTPLTFLRGIISWIIGTDYVLFAK